MNAPDKRIIIFYVIVKCWMKNERFFLLMLALLQFTNIMDFMIMMPLGPQLMRLFDIGPDQFSLAVSAYTISAGISGIAGAFWLDRLDRKQALLLMYGGFLAGTLCCALAPSYILLVTARIVTGAFGGILGAIVFSIVADIIPEARRGSAMGIVSTSFSMASVFGVPFGLYLATLLSWHAPFYAIVVIGAIIYGVLMKVLPPMRSHFQHHHVHGSPWQNVKTVLADPVVRRSLLFMVLLMFGQFSIIPFISPYMVANVGIREQHLPFIYFFGGAATIFSSPLVGKISDAIGKPKVFTFFAVIAIIPVLIITNLPVVSLPIVLTITTIFFIVTNGRMVPAMAIASTVISPERRGTFMSINASVMQMASGVASFIAGHIVTKSQTGALQNYQYVGFISAAAGILCLLMLPVLISSQKKSVQ